MIDRFIEVDSSRLCLVNVSGPGAGEPLAPVPLRSAVPGYQRSRGRANGRGEAIYAVCQ